MEFAHTDNELWIDRNDQCQNNLRYSGQILRVYKLGYILWQSKIQMYIIKCYNELSSKRNDKTNYSV